MLKILVLHFFLKNYPHSQLRPAKDIHFFEKCQRKMSTASRRQGMKKSRLKEESEATSLNQLTKALAETPIKSQWRASVVRANESTLGLRKSARRSENNFGLGINGPNGLHRCKLRACAVPRSARPRKALICSSQAEQGQGMLKKNISSISATLCTCTPIPHI